MMPDGNTAALNRHLREQDERARYSVSEQEACDDIVDRLMGGDEWQGSTLEDVLREQDVEELASAIYREVTGKYPLRDSIRSLVTVYAEDCKWPSIRAEEMAEERREDEKDREAEAIEMRWDAKRGEHD